jgi:hypothetical protein
VADVADSFFLRIAERGRGAAGGARFLFRQFAGGVEAIALSIEVDRPLPS